MIEAEVIRSILEKEYGISTEDEFERAVQGMKQLDIGVFCTQFDKGDKNEQYVVGDCSETQRQQQCYL